MNRLKLLLSNPDGWTSFGTPARTSKVILHIADDSQDPPVYAPITVGDIIETVKDLRDGLKEFGFHTPDCGLMSRGEKQCDCGLDDVLNGEDD